MAFDYDQIKGEEKEGGSHWIAYSDLFTTMSVVFLMLYVVSQLRGGAFSVQKQNEHQALQHEVEDLREQLRVYNALKEDHLKNGASDGERKLYSQLMDKLSLLKEEAQDEKEELRKKATENEKKEEAVNQYQQLIRNIINTNLLAKARIQRRDEVIVHKEKDIAQLEKNVKDKQWRLVLEKKEIDKVNSQLQEKMEELDEAQRNNEITKKSHDAQIAALKSESRKTLASLEKKKSELSEQLNATNAELGALGSKVAASEKESKALRSQVQGLGKDLAKAQGLANAQKNLAERIRKNFEKEGIEALVDPSNGEVTLSFGDEYFETGDAGLKPHMQEILKKSVPVYAASLFKDETIAKKISSVEIVGFASPTYKGKYVDPKSLDRKDRAAVSYNLDLSYKRARSIFTYIFDTDKMKFENQERLLPKVKVIGRSFLAELPQHEREIASGTSNEDFCKHFDCKKAQKVLIRFNLGE